MAQLFFESLHLLAVLVLGGALLIQNLALSARLSAEDVINLRKLNKVLGMAAGLVLLLGLVLWLGVGKPAAFYNSNPVFHAKTGLFLILAVLVIPSTRFLKRAALQGEAETQVPAFIRLSFRLQMILVLIIPVLAYLMARGIGISGG